MRTICLALPLLLMMGPWGCEPEDENEIALDGSVEFDAQDSPDQEVTMDAELPDAVSMTGCTSTTECPLMGQTCFRDDAGVGECAECQDNTFCPMDRPFCSVDGQCIPESDGSCRDALDCEDPDRTQCDFLDTGLIGTCVECLGNTDCVTPRPICATTGRCVASDDEAGCENDDACGPLRLCVDDACVERSP